MTAHTTQNMNALRIANEKRGARKGLKLKLSDGHLTIEDVLLPSPMKSVQDLPLIDVLGWLPRFGPRAPANWTKLGAAAMREGVNLLTVVKGVSRADREWVVAYVSRPAMTGAERERLKREREMVRIVEPEELQRVERLLDKTEAGLEVERARADELARQLQGIQFTMPTAQAERMLADLADAVEAHWRAVSGSSPIDDWAMADERLKARKDAILASGAPMLLAVA